jgi:hypothetical protein
MIITDLKWADKEHTTVSAIVDGKQLWIPADPMNRHYAEILRLGMAIAEPPPTL